MGGFSVKNLAFAFGIMGNIVSFFVFLAPLPTFYIIYKKKTTAGFQSVPYVVALFSAMLLMYYAILKTDNGILIITINSFGCLIETIYIGVYIFYAQKKRITMKLLGLMIGGFGMMLALTLFLIKGPLRLRIVGWICLVFSVSVFAAPLCILKQVIRTKSVEYMPVSLSISLTLNAIMWFVYGLLIKDFNISIPNVIGFFFGLIQIVLYMKYRNPKKILKSEEKIPCDKIIEHQMTVRDDIPKKIPSCKREEQVIDVVKLSAILCSEIIPHLNGNAINEDFNHLNIPKPNMGIPVIV